MIYTFHRQNGFYPIELESNEEARKNAVANPGTIKVVNESTGVVVFNGFHPTHGMAYLCLKGNSEQQTKKGKVYVFNREMDLITTYSSRWANSLCGAYNALRQPGAFEPVPNCPICKVAIMWDDQGTQIHDAVECEEERRQEAIAAGK